MNKISKTEAIDRCMFSLLWIIPGSGNWNTDLHEEIRKELEKVYNAGKEMGLKNSI